MTMRVAAAIRPATMEDRDAVQRLWDDTGLGRAAPDEWEALMSGSTAVILVAELEGAIAGTAIASFDGWRAYIYHVAVEAERRQQGIGHQLMEEAERYLHSTGARFAYITVHQENTEGLALGATLGYLPEGEIVLGKRIAVRAT
jgi:ribosomal protein S18 acetylase RimI-like enzyme